MSDEDSEQEQEGPGHQQGSRTLRALATSALALPGIAGSAVADSPRERPELSYRYSYYKEDETAVYKVAPGATTERYTIHSHQFHYGTPWSERVDLDFNLLYESMSGASPITVEPGGSGVRLVMSGPTIEETRVDVLGAANYYFDNGRAGGSLGVSHENDYLAVNLGADGERHFNDKNSTLLGGVGMSFDKLEPTDPALSAFRPKKESKESYALFVGLAQVINRHLTTQSTVTYKYSTGYLSDPYKEVFVDGGRGPDQRPEQRHQIALLHRVRGHFDQVNGTVHVDTAFSWDDWGVNALTLELAWHQSIWEAFKLVPHFRYFTQSQADFYEPTYGGAFDASQFYSSDYRLSPFGALSYGIKAQTNFRGMWKTDWDAALSYEKYVSDADLALGRVATANPGLVNYHLISVRLTGKF